MWYFIRNYAILYGFHLFVIPKPIYGYYTGTARYLFGINSIPIQDLFDIYAILIEYLFDIYLIPINISITHTI